MKLLVLGGTKFLGRHTVDAALAAGHDVTIFSRGQTNPELYPDVERLTGNRDGDLGALEGRTWDGVVDTSGSPSTAGMRSARRVCRAPCRDRDGAPRRDVT